VRKDALAKLESSAGVMTTAAWGAERPHAKQQARDRRSARHAIGGVAIHLIQSLDGYIGTLAALDAAGYRDTEGPGEDEKIVDAQLAHARRGVSAAERASTFGEMRTKHERLAALARKPRRRPVRCAPRRHRALLRRGRSQHAKQRPKDRRSEVYRGTRAACAHALFAVENGG
jgi:hypothetical protein